MADPLSGGGQPTQPKGTDVISRLDFGIYQIEKAIAWTSLLAMSFMYFFGIVEREINAKAGTNAIEHFIVKRLLGYPADNVPQSVLDSVHSFWGPATFIAILVSLLLAFAFTVRTHNDDPEPTTGKRMVFFGIGAGIVALFFAAMYTLPSKWLIVTSIVGVYVAGTVSAFKSSASQADRTRLFIKAGLWLAPAIGLIAFAMLKLESKYVWAKELSMLLLMWVGFLGASMATFEDRNIQVDFVRKNVAKRYLRHYEAFGSLVTSLFTVVLAVLAYDSLAQGMENGVLLSSVTLPDYFITMPICLGFILVAARMFMRCIRLVAGLDEPPGLDMAPESPKPFFIITAIIFGLAALAILGIGPRGGGLIAVVLMLLLVGAPLYVVIGGLALGCFAFWPQLIDWSASFEGFTNNFNLMARMRDLADQEALIAIPFFMIAGAIMSRGAIAGQLVECARAAFGWMPGGLAISAVVACMFFAAISGSSPVTVITIGAVMFPALKEAKYDERFSLGLVTSAGSLGIIIPPSIPMIVYAIFATMSGAKVLIKDLFIAGILPGLVIGSALAVLCVIYGRAIATEPFDWKRFMKALKDGIWALFLPAFILVGIYFGIFNAIEAAAIAVILSLIIELFIHKQLKLEELPGVLTDSASLMGSILVIIAVALGLSEFLTVKEIPIAIVNFLAQYELTPLTFLLLLNVMLIIVGCLMDIISALILFVPLIIPLALQLEIDPIHLGLIFIVNLEIGYLTPPLGLNLFVSSGFFQKPFGEVMRSVLPFIGALIVSLVIVTAFPILSLGPVNLMNADGKQRPTAFPSGAVLKPTDGGVLDTTPTDFVSEMSGSDGGEAAEDASLGTITNLSRSSNVETEADAFIDFETNGVRGYAMKVDGKHTRTVVLVTAYSAGCGEPGAPPDEADDFLLRLEIPAGVAASKGFKVGKGAVKATFTAIEGGEEKSKRDATDGVIFIVDPEKGEAIAEMKDGLPEGLFGAFELSFGDDTMKGKFVVAPCEDGTVPYYK